MNTTPGPENVSSTDDRQTVASPNLKSPTIFVYVISILAGLAAGGIMSLFANSEIFRWPIVMLYISPFAGIGSGIIAAWFWTCQMARHVRKKVHSINITIFGMLWGLFAGWIAAILLWLIAGFALIVISLTSIDKDVLFSDFFIGSCFGVGFFGSIGGLGAGIICGVAWAIWTRPGK